MTGFHEIRFPLRLALGTSGGPVRRTDIVNLSNGRENRNARWRGSRRSYDAGSGIRSLADLWVARAGRRTEKVAPRSWPSLWASTVPP